MHVVMNFMKGAQENIFTINKTKLNVPLYMNVSSTPRLQIYLHDETRIFKYNTKTQHKPSLTCFNR